MKASLTSFLLLLLVPPLVSLLLNVSSYQKDLSYISYISYI